MFANRHDLRQIRIYSGNYHLLVDGLKSVIALDFDFDEKLLFWSDIATETISMSVLYGFMTIFLLLTDTRNAVGGALANN